MDLEQIRLSIGAVAEVAAIFYKSLIGSGIDESTAIQMTALFLGSMFGKQ